MAAKEHVLLHEFRVHLNVLVRRFKQRHDLDVPYNATILSAIVIHLEYIEN